MAVLKFRNEDTGTFEKLKVVNDGVTFTPVLDEATGILSWTNNGHLPNPPDVNVRPKGIEIYPTKADFPTRENASENCVYIDKANSAMYRWDAASNAYPPLSSVGIQSAEIDEDYNLVFTLIDESKIKVELPNFEGGVKFKYVEKLPMTGMKEGVVYLVKTSLSDNEDFPIYRNYVWSDNKWEFISTSGIPIATKTSVGLVKPDGESIVIDDDGTISVDMDYVYDSFEDMVSTGGLASTTDIDNLFM